MEERPLPSASAQIPPKLSQQLLYLASLFNERKVHLHDVIAVTQKRGHYFLLICLSVPFLSPIPLPGVSVMFGLAMGLIGIRIAFGQNPWLPKRLLEKELSARYFPNILQKASRGVAFLERFLKPRLVYLHDRAVFQQTTGGMITICGLLLLPPLPVPFANFLPAVSVLLLAAAALERDGYFFVVGTAVFLITCGFFVVLGLGGVEAFEQLQKLWKQ